MSTDLGGLYAAARGRITSILADLPAEAAERVCTATPEWTVHDVLAHLRGITEDVRTGNLDGVTTDPWTDAQVQRHRDTTMADLLAGWDADAPLVEAVLSAPGGEAVQRAVFDVHAHEADLRGALGLPGVLPDEFGAWATPIFAQSFIATVHDQDLPAVQIVTHEGDHIGSPDAPTVLRIGRFELFRSQLGRRSAAQVGAYDWGDADPSQYLEHYFVFGPRTDDLVE